MSTYTYSISEDFPNEKVAPEKLRQEIVGSGEFAPTFEGVDTHGDDCDLTFGAALSEAEEAALDAIVAAHDGIEVVYAYKIASTIIGQSQDIVDDQTWQELGGVAVNVQFYCQDLAKAYAIVEYSAKAVGSGAQLRVIEVDDDGNVVVMSDAAPLADSSGAWKVAKFLTNHSPASGDRTYILQGRLNGATSASVRFASFVLVEVTAA